MEKFVLYPEKKTSLVRSIAVTPETYDILLQLKKQTGIPVCTLAETAIMFALERVEIRRPDSEEEAQA